MKDENKELKKIKNKSELTEVDKAFASLVFIGWKQIDAYKVTNPTTTANWNSINAMTSLKWANPKVKDYVQKLDDEMKVKHGGVMQSNKNEEDSDAIRTKEELILLVNRHLKKADTANDSKLVDSLTARLESLQQLKKEQTETEQQVKYYLPLPESEYIDYIQSRIKTDSQFADTLRSML